MPSRPLVRFIARRLGALIALSIGITFIAFALTQLVPGDPIRANLGQIAQSDPQVVAAFRHHYGLDKPLPVQYLKLPREPAARRPRRVRADARRVRHDLAQFVPRPPSSR